MLLRVFRHRLRAAAAETFEAFLRSEGIAALRSRPGVRAAYVGRDPEGAFCAVSVWASFDELTAATGRDLMRPLVDDRWSAELVDPSITHWEALDLPTIGGGESPRVLRVVTGNVRPDAEASYFSYVRTTGWATLSSMDGIVGAWAGRRTDGPTDRFLALTAWRSRETIDALGASDRPILDDDAVRLLTVQAVEHFDVIAPAGEAMDRRPDRSAGEDPRVPTA